jgi:glycosyltransferase involved in cell wall biosynthesis
VDISIIIPSKDRLWSLPKAVESCRSSTLRMQIIVIDDASTDGTADWLRTQPDITVIKGDGWGKRWGVNQALSLATGKYLRYLDSDDWLVPGANEKQFEELERDGADVSVAGFNLYFDEAFERAEEWPPTDDFIAQQLGETAGSHYSAFLFRREFVQDIPHREMFLSANVDSRDDRCFMLEVALRHPKISVCATPTLCHRHHLKGRLQFHHGLTATGTHLQHLFIYKQILRLLDECGELTQRRRKAAAKALWPLAHWIACSHVEDACQLVDWIRALDPEFQVPEKGLLGSAYRKLGFRNTERLLNFRRQLLAFFRTNSPPQDPARNDNQRPA